MKVRLADGSMRARWGSDCLESIPSFPVCDSQSLLSTVRKRHWRPIRKAGSSSHSAHNRTVRVETQSIAATSFVVMNNLSGGTTPYYMLNSAHVNSSYFRIFSDNVYPLFKWRAHWRLFARILYAVTLMMAGIGLIVLSLVRRRIAASCALRSLPLDFQLREDAANVHR